jgi:hypothetical protein
MDNELRMLNEEIENYSFDVRELSENEKEEIKNLYVSMRKISQNRNIIENVKNTNIRINKMVLINGTEHDNYDINDKSGLHFANCHNTTVIITNKVCHITSENCNNFTIKIIGGSISGMDIINCENVNTIIENSSINFLDISKSHGCILYISEKNALNTTILSYESQNIQIIMTDEGFIKNKYTLPMSYFEICRIYTFELVEDGTVQLYYLIPKSKSRNISFFSCQYSIFDQNNKKFVKGEK